MLLEKGGSWKYVEGAIGHDAGFEAPAFDDSGWPSAPAPFGSLYVITPLGPEYTWTTDWTNDSELTLRAHIDVPADALGVMLRWFIDYSATVYFDGVEVASVPAPDGITGTRTIDLGVVAAGDHVIAVRAYGDAPGHNLFWMTASALTPDAWDIYDAAELLGAPIATLENAKGRWIRSELHGLGEGGFTINRHAAEATEDNLAEGNMVKVRIADCGPDYIDGFFLPGDGDYTLLSGQGGEGKEDLVFRGDGALSYLDRARMLPCSYSLEDINGTWTKIWATTAVNRPIGVAYDSAMSGYVFVGGLGSRKVKKLDQATRAVIASSAALWPGDRAMGGISFDPDDATIMWVLEAPWLLGSGANTKIRKYSRGANGLPTTLLDTYDLGSAVQLTDIRVDGDYVWTSRYDNDRIQQRSKADPTNVIHSSTITYKGKVQRKPNGIAINGTKVAYWFGGDAGGGTGRALVADTSAYTTITGVQNTKNVSAFGGEWTTEGGEDFLYAVSYTAGKTWKYQLTVAEPRCADDSGTFHPDQVAPGAIAWRVLVEITHVNRPSQPCPELFFDFTEDADSNGTPWPARTSTEEFTWRVGDRAWSDVLARLIPAGVTFDFDVNTMTLHAYVDADFGTDRTAASFGTGKVRFVEAVNLAVNGDLGRRDNRGLPATNLTVLGDGGIYGSASLAGRYVREGFMQVSGPSTEAVLDAIGDDELARERLVADALGFATLWAVETEDASFSDLELLGRYVPKRHYWKGDLVRVDMVAGEFAYNETDLRVYGTLITERDAKQAEPGGEVTAGWRSALDLGSAYKIPEPIDSTGGSGSNPSSGGGGSSGGSTVITSIPLTFENEDASVVIPRVTKVIANGIISPSPGVVVLPDATNPPESDGGTGDYVLVASQNGCALDTDLDSGGGTDDTTALQALLDVALSGGRVMVILDGPALVTGLDVHSNTTLLSLNGGGLYLADGSDRAIIRNANRSRGAVTDEYITIIGGYFNGNEDNQADDADDTNVDGLQFLGVNYLRIRDVDVHNVRHFSCHVGNWTHLTIDGYSYDRGPNPQFQQDGIHLNGPGQYGYIANAKIRSYDDAIAVNAGDDSAVDLTITNPHGPYVGQGTISDLVIDGVELVGARCGVRLLSHDADSRIDRVQVRNVTGTVIDEGMLIGSFAHTGSASIGDVVVDGFDVHNITTAGHANAMFLVEDTAESLTFRNVKVHIPDNDRPIFWFDDSVEADSVEIEDFTIYENGTAAIGMIPVKLDGYIKRLRGTNWNWVRLSGGEQTAPFISMTDAASQVDALVLNGIQANLVDSILIQSAGSIGYIQAANIRHEDDFSNATFVSTAGTIAEVTISNWFGSTPFSGTATVTSGDAFGAPVYDTDGLIPITTTDTVSVDTGSPPGVTITTKWGIDGSDLPYYDTAGATAGEEAALFFDPATDHYVLVAFEF